jgi:hypothetical protein
MPMDDLPPIIRSQNRSAEEAKRLERVRGKIAQQADWLATRDLREQMNASRRSDPADAFTG